MKKIFSLVALVLTVAMTSLSVTAQQMPQAPADKDVRVGKLANGLTYYIRHNEYPKGQVDFHIAQKVGSIQEEDNQRGLAHFLEHMCFNGTKNFPGNNMINWLESKGVKFGAHLNAYTSTDRTVYRITNVPNTANAVDSCLLILHDWADDLTLATEEIDKERGVIHEEWRLGGAFVRMIEKEGPTLYPGSKYANRLPIGTMEVVDNFKPEALRSYYEAWYRPDLQGVVVVGDIDVDQIETKIKELFGAIKMPTTAGKFEYYPVPDNDEPIFVAYKDKEMSAALLMINVKYDPLSREYRNTDAQILTDYMEGIAGIIMNERLNDIQLKPNSPFGSAGADFDSYLLSKNKNALGLTCYVNEKGNKAALTAALTELKRIKDYGFTAAEYDRARTQYLSRMEKQYSNRTKQKNEVYAQEYISNFIDNTPMTGIEYEYDKVKMTAPMIPVDVVNGAMKEILNGKNLVVIALGPDKADYTLPTIDEMKQVLADVNASTVEAPKNDAVTEPLMSTMPKAGKIVSEKAGKFGFTELKLSNGVKVLLKQTDYKDDEVRLYAASDGGASLYSAADYPTVSLSGEFWSANGIDKFSATDLQKMLSGKIANVSLSVEDYEESINGSSTPKDLETMMQLLYLNLTKPRYDKEAFEATKQLIASQVKNLAANPNYVFADSVARITYNHNPKAEIISMDVLNKVDYDRMTQIMKERFGNAAEFTYFIAGNFDMPTMKKYVEQYIASLPAKKAKKEVAANDGKARKTGVYASDFQHKTENNLAMLMMQWTAKVPYTAENRILASVAGQLMSKELLNRVREDEGAAYSPFAQGMMHKTYDSQVMILTSFGMNPDKRATSEATTIDCFEDLSKEVKAEELDKIKEYMIKQIDENERKNSYWIAVVEESERNGIDVNSNYRNFVKNLTVKDVQSFIKSVIDQGNRAQITMMPEK